MRGALRFSLVLLAAIAAATPAARASVSGLSAGEAARLERGETVTREQTLDGESRRYVGGITYTIVEATPVEIAGLLEDMRAYKEVLPRTKQARLVGKNGPDLFVELRQGNALVEAAYTIRVRPDPARGEVRFWLDPNKPHAIDDAWGFFRYQALPDAPTGAPRTLVTYGALVDLGPGIVRELFEERLRSLMLTVPQMMRQYLAENVRASRGS
jgi:hypothetical protein